MECLHFGSSSYGSFLLDDNNNKLLLLSFTTYVACIAAGVMGRKQKCLSIEQDDMNERYVLFAEACLSRFGFWQILKDKKRTVLINSSGGGRQQVSRKKVVISRKRVRHRKIKLSNFDSCR